MKKNKKSLYSKRTRSYRTILKSSYTSTVQGVKNSHIVKRKKQITIAKGILHRHKLTLRPRPPRPFPDNDNHKDLSELHKQWYHWQYFFIQSRAIPARLFTFRV